MPLIAWLESLFDGECSRGLKLECQKQCQKDKKCKGFSYDSDRKHCWLLSFTDMGRKPVTSFISGPKYCSGTYYDNQSVIFGSTVATKLYSRNVTTNFTLPHVCGVYFSIPFLAHNGHHFL